MAVIDDEDTEQQDPPAKEQSQPAPVYAQVDEESLANAISRSLQQTTGRQQDNDAIAEMVSNLKKEGYKDDAITLACLTAFGVEKKLRAEFSRELKKQNSETLARSRDQQAEEALERQLHKVIQEDERLKHVKESIRKEAIDKYFADNQRLQKWNRGEVDRIAVADAVDAAADTMLKNLGLAKDQRNPAAKPEKSKASAEEKQAANEAGKQSGSYKERLEDHQIDAYNQAVHSNLKFLNVKDKAEAEKKAFEYASKIPKPKLAQRLG